MPIYEYQCGDCGHELEVMRKISAGPLTECPACGKNTLNKRISKVAFRLKGTGWYETDFKDKPAVKDKEDKGSKTTSATEKAAESSKKDASKDSSPAKTTAKSDD